MKTENSMNSTFDYFSTDHLKSDLKRHAIQGGGITVFSRILHFSIHMISTMVLARLLTPDDFGLFAMVTAITGFLVIVRDLGLTDATIQKAEINHSQISTLFWINVIISLIIVLLISLFSPLIAWFYNDERLKLITVIWSLNIFLSALSTQHIALMKRNMFFFQVSMIEILAVFFGNASAIILAFYGWSYWALVSRPLVLVLTISAGAWVVCRWRPGIVELSAGVRSMMAFGANITGYYFTNYFSRNLDKIIIGWSNGAKELGFYHKAFYLFLLPSSQLNTSLRNVAVATLSKLRDEPDKYQHYFLHAISVVAFIGMPVSFFFMIESADLVFLLLGPQWGKTAEIFQILAAGTGVWIIYSTLYWLHASLGTSDRLLRWGIFALCVTTTAILAGLPFGTKGVATSYTCALYLLTGLGLKYAAKPIKLKLRTIFSAIWRYFTAAVFAGLLCWYLIQPHASNFTHLTRFITSFLLYLSLYLIFVVLFHRTIKPITTFFSLIRQMLPKHIALRSK